MVKSRSSKRLFLQTSVALGLALCTLVRAQSPAETLWVQVIFYDFHPTASNPNFEAGRPETLPGWSGGATTGMIQNHLDGDRKPLLQQNKMWNDRVNEWFRPSGCKDCELSPRFQYSPSRTRWEWAGMENYQGRANEWVSPYYNAGDAMANVVIYDSLLFTLTDASTGTYEFDDQEFFPLDGRGFGTEPAAYGPYSWTNTENRNYSFAMEIHRKFTYREGLTFNFRGDDDVWAFIDGQLQMDIGGIHGAVSDFIDMDNLGLQEGKTYDFDFFYAERHVTQSSIRITTNLVSTPPPSVFLIAAGSGRCAGDTIDMTVTIRDENDSLRNAEYGDSVSWEIVSGSNPASTLPITSGDTVDFMPTEAYDTVRIAAHLDLPSDGIELHDTVKLITTACYPDHISIESDSIITEAELVDDNPATIVLLKDESQDSAVGIVRDRFGNYMRLADRNNTTWDSNDKSVVTVQGKSGRNWTGVITRGDTGTTKITATEGSLRGEGEVQVRAGEIVGLRFYDLDGDSAVTGIQMTTDDSIRLRLEAEFSHDRGSWVEVSGDWDLTANSGYELKYAGVDPPSDGTKWIYSPTTPGEGKLSATNGVTKEIDVKITPAPPSQVSIELITPDDSLIAGEPISAKIEIRNSDGLYPGQWCGSANFSDILGKGYTDEDPLVIITDPSDGSVDTLKLTDAISQYCIQDGLDTVQFVLYYAPEDKSPHNITVKLDDRLTDNTGPFVLKPGPLHKLELEDLDGNTLGDTVTIEPGGSLVAYSRGYDKWGNPRGNEFSDWTTGGDLPSLPNSNNQFRQYYDGSSVLDRREGDLKATAVGTQISDQVYVVFTGSGVPLSYAITRDYDGNGYLDAVEIRFNEPVELPSDYNYRDSLLIQYGNVTFENYSLEKHPDNDSIYVLKFKEDSTTVPDQAQTDWRPYISIKGWEDVRRIPLSAKVKCLDGAGPVIWKVEKHSESLTDRTKDKIRVIMSESVLDAEGNSINVNTDPKDLFLVYVWNSKDQRFDTLHTMLDSIDNLARVVNDSIIEFRMENGKDLSTSHWLNINMTNAQVRMTDGTDQTNNPHVDNRKVQVLPVSPVNPPLIPFPNPSAPTFRREPPGYLSAGHKPVARQWVRDDESGVVLNFPLPIPGTSEDRTIKVYFKIYDAVGNLVNSTTHDDLLATIDATALGTSSTYNIDLYWNLSNAQGMPVAPGTYRVVVYVDYSSPKYEDTRMYTNVGVGR